MSVDFHELVTNLTADGNVPSASPWYDHGGGRVTYAAQGTFGSGTVALQFSLDDGSTWSSVGSAANLTAAGVAGAEIPPCLIRVNLSGSTSPNLNVVIGHTGGDFMTG